MSESFFEKRLAESMKDAEFRREWLASEAEYKAEVERIKNEEVSGNET